MINENQKEEQKEKKKIKKQKQLFLTYFYHFTMYDQQQNFDSGSHRFILTDEHYFFEGIVNNMNSDTKYYRHMICSLFL